MKAFGAAQRTGPLVLALAIGWSVLAGFADASAGVGGRYAAAGTNEFPARGAPAMAPGVPAYKVVDEIDWHRPSVDLSFLNAIEKPAGKRGFVRAKGDSLVFADGTPVRFWGTNLSAAAIFRTDREAVREQARRLSELGFNLVRLHHHDSYWNTPNIFGEANPSHTGDLDSEMLDRIDWWVACLKQEGIYVWLDLHVQRQLREGDRVSHFAEIGKHGTAGEFKGFNYVNRDIRQAMKRFNSKYLGHRNPYTKLAYKDEPAVAAVLITNENDVTQHFANALLPDKAVPAHTALYMKEAADFARQRGLPADKTWRSWEYGPSRLFLNDLEYRFNVEMIQHLRATGVKVPIVTTSIWGGQVVSLPALTAGDMIDVHAYERSGPLQRDPHVEANTTHNIASAQLSGKPLSVSEWNMGAFPADDRHVMPLYLAATASHQGWDALMQYAYAQTPLHMAGHASNWNAFNDPSLMALLPAAALLYRRADVREARSTIVFAPTKPQVFDHPLSTAGSVAVRTAAETGRLVTLLPAVDELPWLRGHAVPAGATVITDMTHSFVEAQRRSVSDTGELRRDWGAGVFTIDTPRTQAVLGQLGGKVHRLTDVAVAFSGNGSLAVQSLDGEPLSRSRNIVVSIGTSSVPARGGAALPFVSEPLRGSLKIKAGADLRLDGQPGVSLQSASILAPGQVEYQVVFDGGAPVHWLHLHKPGRTSR